MISPRTIRSPSPVAEVIWALTLIGVFVSCKGTPASKDRKPSAPTVITDAKVVAAPVSDAAPPPHVILTGTPSESWGLVKIVRERYYRLNNVHKYGAERDGTGLVWELSIRKQDLCLLMLEGDIRKTGHGQKWVERPPSAYERKDAKYLRDKITYHLPRQVETALAKMNDCPLGHRTLIDTTIPEQPPR